jgi:hypothetical protein
MTLRFIGFLMLAVSVHAGDSPATADAKSPITPKPASPGPWRIGVGAMWRNIGELSVDPNLRNSGFANRFFVAPAGAGETGVFANRSYDDGFVNIGAATPASGLTTNWGHQNDSQFRGGSLNYTLSGGAAQSLPGPTGDDEDSTAAPFIEISHLRPIRPNLIAGFTANLSLAGLDGRADSAMSNSTVSISDRYALGGVIPPSAPYTGSFTGPGPLIPNQPTSRDFILTPNGGSSYHFAHDTDLYSLALGGEIHWQHADSFYLGIGLGAVLNLADWSASWNMPVPDASGRGSNTIGGADSGGDFLWGIYLKGSAGYRINQQWSIEGFYRYDWNETLRNSVGASSFDLGLTGWSAGLGVILHF